jgi:hypothetical protein
MPVNLTITAADGATTTVAMPDPVINQVASGPMQIWQQGQVFELAGSPYYAKIEAASGGTNVGPSGTPVAGQAQYLAVISSPDISTWPNNVTIQTAYGQSTGSVQGYFYLVYGDQALGKAENGSYPRPRPPNPAPSQVANFAQLISNYNATTTQGANSTCDVIYDIWFNSANINGSYYPYPGDSRTHEFDIATFIPGGFADIGRRMFTIAGSGAWDGNDLKTANFSWRFITARPNVTSGTVNLLPIWRQMIWTGYADGREWVVGINYGVEPITGSQTTVVNNFGVNWVSNPNIVIAANATGAHPGTAGYHFVGAGAGQGSKVSFPNASTSYNVKRMGGRVLVRSGNDPATQDFIEACDNLVFSDRSFAIATMPGVADVAFVMPLPVVTGKVIGKILASGSPTSWSISNDPAGNFAIDATGTLSLTATGAANLAPPALVAPGPSLTGSWSGAAAPGTGFRVAFAHGGSVFTNATAAPQIQIKIATASGNTGGTLDSMYVGNYSGSNGQFSGTPIQVTFGGSTSLTLAPGAATYTSDPISLPVNNLTSLVVGFHVTGAGVRLVNGFFGASNTASWWATGVADVGGGTFTATSANGGQVIGITEIDGSTNKWVDIEVKATNANGASVGCVTIGSPAFDGITLPTANSLNGDMARGGVATTFYKTHAEMKVTALGSGAALGFVNANETLANTVMGASVNSIGAFTDGTIRTNGVVVGNLARALAVGDTICMDLDFDTQLGWWGINGSDPTAGISGGININPIAQYHMPGTGQFIVGGPNCYAAVYIKGGATVAPNLGSAPYSFVPPTGFTGWRWQ